MLLTFNPHRRVAGGGVAMEEAIFEGTLKVGTRACLVEKRKDDIPGREHSEDLTTPPPPPWHLGSNDKMIPQDI